MSPLARSNTSINNNQFSYNKLNDYDLNNQLLITQSKKMFYFWVCFFYTDGIIDLNKYGL